MDYLQGLCEPRALSEVMKINIHKVLFGNAALTVIKSIMPIVLVPLYIKTWGNETYSDWLVVISIVSFLGLLDFGLIHYASTHLHILKTKGRKYFLRVNNVILSFFIVMLFGFFIIFGSILFILSTFNIDLNYYLVTFLSLSVGGSIVSSYLISLFRACDRNHYGIYLSIIYNTILYAGIFVLLKYYYSNPAVIALWMLLLVSVMICLIIFTLQKLFHLRFEFQSSPKKYLVYLNKSIFFILFTLASALKAQLPILILSLGSAIYVVMFVLHRTIINIQNQLLVFVHTAIWQDLTRSFVMRKVNVINNTFFLNYLFMGMSSITLSFLFYGWYESIFRLWIGEDYLKYLDKNIMAPFLVLGVLNTLWNSGTIFLVSKNDHIELSKKMLVYIVIANLISMPVYLLYNLETYLLSLVFLEIIFGIFWIQRFILYKIDLTLKSYIQSFSVLILYSLTSLSVVFLVNSKVLVSALLILLFLLGNLWLIFLFKRYRLKELFSH